MSWRRNWTNPMAEREGWRMYGYTMIHPQSLRYLTWKPQKWMVSKFGISRLPGADVQVNHAKLQGCIWDHIDILDDSNSNNDNDNHVNNDNDYRKDKTHIHILIVMTICIFMFIHSLYIYIQDTQYMLHRIVPDLQSTVLGRPRVSMVFVKWSIVKQVSKWIIYHTGILFFVYWWYVPILGHMLSQIQVS